MNRRKFGILGASSLIAMLAYLGKARPARASADPNLLNTTLTPFGAERAGNPEGTIPAWTGGLTELPPGWDGTQGLMPDFFADDKKLFSIDASNMDQYKDKLAEGTMLMMRKYGFRIDVYPTHRTQSAPQWVYDNTAINVTAAIPDPHGVKYGFTGGYGGPPFPIPDTDPSIAGAQLMWNHATPWQGQWFTRCMGNFLVDSTGSLILADQQKEHAIFLYYLKGKTVADYEGLYAKYLIEHQGPASLQGQEAIDWFPTNTFSVSDRVWSYLPGQGRMREDPNLEYDTPAPSFADYANQDEYNIMNGALDRYDWKLLGKKEMFIPYNNNKAALATAEEAHLPHFLDPDIIRWELHRVWVVDAVVSPGKRNVLAHRRFYLDEDTYAASLGDSWDAQGNYWRHGNTLMMNRPDYPAGALFGALAMYDLQAGHYLTSTGQWNETPYNAPVDFSQPEMQIFNPRTMAAQAQY
jgi:hypothetical protein